MNEEIPACIKTIANELNSLHRVDNKLVADIISSVNLSEKELNKYVSFDHDNYMSYGRKLILDNGNFKILLMSWSSGNFTAIHNHGYSEWGCVYFFGDATHRLYETNGESLELIQKDNFHKEQIAAVCGDLTHMMGNPYKKEFITLHIYGSNTRKRDVSDNARVYLPEFQKEVTTKGSAYLNMNSSLVLSEKPFSNLSQDDFYDYFTLVKPFYESCREYDIISQMEKKLLSLN